MNSKRFTLNSTDVNNWLNNSLVFLAPFALVFLVSIQSGTSFKDSLNVLYLYALNISIDLLRKFVAQR